jgi:hypothetical protein
LRGKGGSEGEGWLASPEKKPQQRALRFIVSKGVEALKPSKLIELVKPLHHIISLTYPKLALMRTMSSYLILTEFAS